MPLFNVSVDRAKCFCAFVTTVSPKLAVFLLTASSFSLYASTALAQTSRPNIPIRNPDGSVTVDNNARDIRTGPLQNTSDIPLPSLLPASTTNTVPVPVDTSRQAPNTVLTQPDLPYIQRSFDDLINNDPNADVQYTLQPETVQ
ncbi:MAG: hypothetical protein WBD47_12280, partial [Phormidesmis sp.]